jgi:formylglycine-generating enzyme required for sulfatase activity
MRAKSSTQNQRTTTALAALTLMLCAIGLLPWSPSQTAHAQQDRQLQQTGSANANDGKRIALVIGNGAYTNAPPLKNPPNDARDMAATLKALGFDVASGINVNQREMKSLIRDFGQKLKVGGSGLFYYAGHGVQSKGRNYLIPVEADIQSEAEVEDASVDVNLVLNYMDDAQNGLNIVILDACRNNPFGRSFRSAINGLAQVDAPTGTLIAYATAPGRVASDGLAENGMYTSELLKQMRVPGLSATEMFMRVRAEVMKQTSNKQVPWEASSLVGTFYFSKSPATSSTTNLSLSNTPAKIDAVAVEREYWETIRSSNDAQDYKDYLQSYPNGAYTVIARAKIRQIEMAKNPQPANSQPTNAPPSNSGGNKRSAPAGAANTSSSPPKSFKSQQGIEMVYIPPGKYTMGSHANDKETPVHDVTISQAFYMGKYEVTQGQWQAVMGSNPSHFKDCGSNCPVENATWNDAQDFIKKLNEANDGYTYRLPSEAEWEYACRAGTTGDYYAADVADIGWYKDNSEKKTHAVGSKQPNAFGLYDMSGNVWEWCQDVGESVFLPVRVMRGGSWVVDATRLRSADRGRRHPDTRHDDFGFRVVAVARTQ